MRFGTLTLRNSLATCALTVRSSITRASRIPYWSGLTATELGQTHIYMLGAVVESEREMLRERVKAGMPQVWCSERHVGRPALRRFKVTEIEKTNLLQAQA